MAKSTKQNQLDLILARADQSNADKLRVMKITSEALGDVIVKIPPFKKVSEWIDEISEKGEMLSTYEATLGSAQLVFDSIPFLKDNFKELSEAYDEKDPAHLTVKIFETAGALGEINDIADVITQSLGADKQVIKNL